MQSQGRTFKMVTTVREGPQMSATHPQMAETRKNTETLAEDVDSDASE